MAFTGADRKGVLTLLSGGLWVAVVASSGSVAGLGFDAGDRGWLQGHTEDVTPLRCLRLCHPGRLGLSTDA